MENLVWKSCITAKYGTEDWGWFTTLPRGSCGVGLWKFIAKESGQLKKDCVFKLGDGKKIIFWEDNWCGRAPLCESISIALLAQKGLWLQICGGSKRVRCLGSQVFEAI